ncbi:MAG: dienelactone hydrolase family protein [Chloroflexota bacterium]|nr:MAG: dienelactone hydrolase family protein [Chloroflexota bacterium]
MNTNIHLDQPRLTFGAEIKSANRIVILLHGRGATADSMVPLARVLETPGSRFVMPQAALNRWYPQTAFGPLEANEPDLSSALATIQKLVDDAHQDGFSDQQITFGGFSQGACLASEFVARNARKYAGLFSFSGALIGPRGMPRNYAGHFDSMPVFIGGSDIDPWVDHDLITETASIFKKMGATVDFRTYPGMGHTVNQDEIDSVRKMLANSHSG